MHQIVVGSLTLPRVWDTCFIGVLLCLVGSDQGSEAQLLASLLISLLLYNSFTGLREDGFYMSYFCH